MADSASPNRLPIVLVSLLLLAGLGFVGYMEFLAGPVVDRLGPSAGSGALLTVDFVTARSRVLNRHTSRLVMIEGRDAPRRSNWKDGIEEWQGTDCVMIADGEGIRRLDANAFQELWRRQNELDPLNAWELHPLLVEVADMLGDKQFKAFLDRNRP